MPTSRTASRGSTQSGSAGVDRPPPFWWPITVTFAAILLLLCASTVALDWHANQRPWFVDGSGNARAQDFSTFYVAGRMARAGQAAAAYDPARFAPALEQSTGPLGTHWLNWLNPPPLLLLLGPLSSLPYQAAFWTWFLLGLAPLLVAARLANRWPGAFLVVLATPAGFAVLLNGQNGFLTAALLGFGTMLLARFPIRAGVAIGFLVVKPHLAMILPVLLLAGRHYRAFLAAAVTTLLLSFASAAAFGIESWTGFLSSLGGTVERFLGTEAPRLAMTSPYAAAVRFVPQPWAMALHGLLGAAAVLACIRLWRQSGVPVEIRSAASIAASLLAPPYLYVHDLVALGLAVLLLLAARGGSAPTGPMAMALPLVLLLPAVTLFTGDGRAGLVAVLLILGCALRCADRARHPPGSAR